MTVHRIPITTREDWLAARVGKIGASEIAALFGCHQFKTHFQLYAEKAGLVPAEGPSSAIMERGNILEPAVAEAVRLKRPDWRISKNEDYYWCDETALGATPDYIVHDPARGVGVLQLKAIALPEFQEKWEGGPPMGYILQTTQEVMLHDAHWQHVSAWGAIGVLAISAYSHQCEVWEFDRDASAELRIMNAARKFWANVAAGQQPPPDYARDDEIIKAIYRQDNGETIDLSGDNRLAFLLDERERLATEIATARPAIDQLEAINAEIRMKIGDAAVAVTSRWKITNKLQHRKATAASSFRVLRVTPQGKAKGLAA